MEHNLTVSTKEDNTLAKATDSNIVIERLLDERITLLEEFTLSDVVTLHGPIVWG